MFTPKPLAIHESCFTCTLRATRLFCDLPLEALHGFEAIKSTNAYADGATLFAEGQDSHGIFILCKGKARLSICSNAGKTRILRIAEAGEVLGLSATISGSPYELTAETKGSCKVAFVERQDFLRFLRAHRDACFRVAEELSKEYSIACHEIRSLGISQSAVQKLAKLLLDVIGRNGAAGKKQPPITLGLTHEEMAEMIGTTRETVTRLFTQLKKEHILNGKGSTLLISNKPALERITRGYWNIPWAKPHANPRTVAAAPIQIQESYRRSPR